MGFQYVDTVCIAAVDIVNLTIHSVDS